MSAALPTRILRLVASKPDGMTRQMILDAFPAYTERARLAAGDRLIAARLIAAAATVNGWVWRVTELGASVIASGKPPRWTERRS